MKKSKGRIQQPIDKNRRFVTVKLHTKTTELLELIARAENITRSYLISIILDKYLNEYDIKRLEEIEMMEEYNLNPKN